MGGNVGKTANSDSSSKKELDDFEDVIKRVEEMRDRFELNKGRKYKKFQNINRNISIVVRPIKSEEKDEEKKEIQMKFVKRVFKNRPGMIDSLKNLENLLMRSNTGLCKMEDIFIHRKKKVVMIWEYVNFGDLGRVSRVVGKKFPNRVVSQIMFQLLNGLMFLHIRGVVHGFLEPSKIVLNDKGVLKIAESGLGPLKEDETNPYSCSICEKGKRHPLCDVWSIGVICAELALGKYPLYIKGQKLEDEDKEEKEEENEGEEEKFRRMSILKVKKGKIFHQEDFEIELIDFVYKCLNSEDHKNSESNVSKLLKHPFIEKYRKSKGKPTFRRWVHDNFVKKLKGEEVEEEGEEAKEEVEVKEEVKDTEVEEKVEGKEETE